MKRRGRLPVLAGLAIVGFACAGSSHGAARPGDVVRAGAVSTAKVRCDGQRPEPRTSRQPIRVLVSLAGSDDRLVAEVTARLLGDLRRFRYEMADPNVGEVFDVLSVADMVADPERARACAEALDADAFVWGTVDRNPDAAAVTVHQDVKIEGSVVAGPGAQQSVAVVDVHGRPPFTFSPQLTLRQKGRWLFTGGRLEFFSLADLDLQKLGENPSTCLIPFLAGISAFEASEDETALKLFELAAPGMIQPGSHQLFFQSYLVAANMTLGRYGKVQKLIEIDAKALEAAEPSVRWQVYMLSGLAAELGGDLLRGERFYTFASATDSLLDDEHRGLALLARAEARLHRGAVEESLEDVSGVRSGSQRCRPGLRCSLKESTAMMIECFAQARAGQTDQSIHCIQSLIQLKNEVRAGLRSAKVDKMATTDGRAESTENPMLAMGFNRWAGACPLIVHVLGSAPRTVQHMVRQLLPRGMLVNVSTLLKERPEILAQNIPIFRKQPWMLGSVLCELSGLLLAQGMIDDAAEMADMGRAQLIAAPNALLRTEGDLMSALVLEKEGRMREAADRIHSALPQLELSMGKDAPNLRVWTQRLRQLRRARRQQ